MTTMKTPVSPHSPCVCVCLCVLCVCRSCASAGRPMGTAPAARSACCVWGTCGRSAATVWVSATSLSPAAGVQDPLGSVGASGIRGRKVRGRLLRLKTDCRCQCCVLHSFKCWSDFAELILTCCCCEPEQHNSWSNYFFFYFLLKAVKLTGKSQLCLDFNSDDGCQCGRSGLLHVTVSVYYFGIFTGNGNSKWLRFRLTLF